MLGGGVLADQVKNIDWRVWKTEFICKLSRETTYEVLDKLGTAADRCELANWNSTNPVDVKMDKKKTVMIVTPDPGAPLLLLRIMRPRRVRFSNGVTNYLSVRLYTSQYDGLFLHTLPIILHAFDSRGNVDCEIPVVLTSQ